MARGDANSALASLLLPYPAPVMSSFTLHPVTIANADTTVPQVLSLIKALALYEKDPDAVLATVPLLRRSFFGEGELGGRYAECVLAYGERGPEQGGEPVGMAVYL